MSVVHTAVSAQPLQPAQAEAEVWSAECGGVVLFCGIVRDHDGGKPVGRLSYTAHPSAEQVLAEVCAEVARKHQVRVWAAHRTGSLEIGDHALVAACASAHRAEAFAACAELIEQIKAQVPIWKEQFYTDGSKDWVGLS
ncbi:molybdenum cofactor biosynthesis protein MoaE [Nesterenkonia alkaliphila]|uniref:Molybdenum cofactor biosynthesis protein MoaE n=1 Tax=Nesterenkonia alkaliphila TaxID=1463631 RepID=A0A7K1UH85_9MICC|nr:molybdenum cofactor biosynthesis protein MoaE [Nesterenkonia alkaliphila]MVT25835.1 molybdenum cofactor biosynthesis protein MoaE [Nesterenkonia alkaliphila]GFZ76715.1 molybdopterin converting factor [Nesterenkonia alkaliphila]